MPRCDLGRGRRPQAARPRDERCAEFGQHRGVRRVRSSKNARSSHTSRNKSMMVRGTLTVVIGSKGLQQRHDVVYGVAVGDEAHAATADT